jgi:hypothetical protein
MWVTGSRNAQAHEFGAVMCQFDETCGAVGHDAFAAMLQ